MSHQNITTLLGEHCTTTKLFSFHHTKNISLQYTFLLVEKDIWDLLEKLELVEEVSGGVLSRGGRDASTLQPPCTHGEH